LHDGDVEPAVELAAHLTLDADQFEPAGRVEGPRRGARGLNSRDDTVEP